MKFIAALIKCYLAAMIVIAGLVATFMLWHIPPHAMAAGANAPAAGVLTVGAYVTMIGLVLAALIIWRLLTLAGHGQLFSSTGVCHLAGLKWAFVTTQLGIALALPAIYQIADEGDAPGLIVMVLMFLAIPFVISLGLAILQRLWPTTPVASLKVAHS
ncbi:DUF2975 domain-containing protein [Lacticaseibacillus daqingensis]|uniref:DUF2975 domain-containing protein n=1 Tax=Lacticaseibacillus daqingensis TaxID=2486014 RepID=UPI000F770E27|nr:DUF2975 domain-containing protein [Lacticaseibacillus daqingensis]